MANVACEFKELNCIVYLMGKPYTTVASITDAVLATIGLYYVLDMYYPKSAAIGMSVLQIYAFNHRDIQQGLLEGVQSATAYIDHFPD